MLPQEVLTQAQDEMLNWQNTGCSVMEVSHRGKDFIACAAEAEQDLRDLMNISDDYHVLFTHGGGRGQFAAVPLNLSTESDKSLHIVSGSWSKGAVEEAQKYNQAEIIASSQQIEGLWQVNPVTLDDDSINAAYCHFCPNETVDGVAFDWLPDVGDVPLVADMSSMILSKPVDVNRYGVIYAGAQKNIGPSGLSIVIVRKDLVGNARRATPSIFDYALLAQTDSMYNTPPTFSWYLAGLVFKWLKRQGGVEQIAHLNQQKASVLYKTIDASDFYQSYVHPNNRSVMNVPFHLANPELDQLFLKQAEENGLLALKGHRIVGGMRASIYNAMPLEGVIALTEFMQEFERVKG